MKGTTQLPGRRPPPRDKLPPTTYDRLVAAKRRFCVETYREILAGGHRLFEPGTYPEET